MEQWLSTTSGEIIFWLGLCSIAVILRYRMPGWIALSLRPNSGSGAEAAVQVATHPVSGKLQVYHLSRWFDAVLIDPANPPLRDGETVYLIRWEARQAWVSRVRSHTPAPRRHRHRRWQWSLH